MTSRQVRRAAERFKRKSAGAKYPRGNVADMGRLTAVPIQRYEPFQPRGKTWPEPGKREAMKRLARTARFA